MDGFGFLKLDSLLHTTKSGFGQSTLLLFTSCLHIGVFKYPLEPKGLFLSAWIALVSALFDEERAK